ncbi:hypothetical protein [Alicyclobacillus sp. SO9]|uniref:hypothetical protein n=1 Tax=Alicyclobacillus sp. SO9 TaxID=2665646 RepID=UPI001E386322|nr:hypothetical protein [Alicyclobacillus sp. SO9]
MKMRRGIVVAAVLISSLTVLTACDSKQEANAINQPGSSGSASTATTKNNSNSVSQSDAKVSAKGVSPKVSKAQVGKAQSTVNKLVNSVNQLH